MTGGFFTLSHQQADDIEIEKICEQNYESQIECKVKVVCDIYVIHNAGLVFGQDLYSIKGNEHNVTDQAEHIERNWQAVFSTQRNRCLCLVSFR